VKKKDKWASIRYKQANNIYVWLIAICCLHPSSAANQRLLLSIEGTDRRTPDRYIDLALYTTWAASLTMAGTWHRSHEMLKAVAWGFVAIHKTTQIAWHVLSKVSGSQQLVCAVALVTASRTPAEFLQSAKLHFAATRVNCNILWNKKPWHAKKQQVTILLLVNINIYG